MALVSKIIGDCPGCGRKDGYGNVGVHGTTLSRGCLSCRRWDQIPLPQLSKKVLYLDQFFYSHAFRGENKNFVEAKEKIEKLSHDQLLVSPYSDIHEDETHLWKPDQRDLLWKFIKQTSSGHQFNAEYQVRDKQLHRAFKAFLTNGDASCPIDVSDALPRNINGWDDYVWIDVKSFRKNIIELRKGKSESVSGLLDLFPKWASRDSTFEADVREEIDASGDGFINSYIDYVKRIADGDYDALWNSPLASRVVEQLMKYGEKLHPSLRMQRIQSFFSSAYFAGIPSETIAAEFYALLRNKLRDGAYLSKEKSHKRFKGFFFDVRFIATYAPYCDAMVVDTVMHQWATDRLIDLQSRFGTKFFSRSNWHEFIDYLDKIDKSRSPELSEALEWVHPPNAKSPDWSAILGNK